MRMNSLAGGVGGKLAVLAAISSLSLLTGCDATSARARDAIGLYDEGAYAQAEATIAPTAQKKDENYVLNNCRLGSCALAAGDLNGAETAFMNAYQVMNSTHVNDTGRTAGAAVVWEGVKVWTGQPFERAMAHYYLGLVFLLHHDYENARAAFQNSLFKLREYADTDNPNDYRAAESNFALGYFGLGYCYLRLGKSQLAESAFNQAAKIDPYLVPVIQQVHQPGINTLIFVDAGQGPQMAAKGWYNEESAFYPSPSEVPPIPPIAAYADGKPIASTNIKHDVVDTLAMAQEQRWQDIDTIRKVKAVAGTGLMAGGAAAADYGASRGDRGLEYGGLGAMVAGAALAASSQADVRYWEMLPRTVYIIPAALPPGPHSIVVTAGGSQSAPLTATVQGPSRQGGDTILYFRLH